jgi:hypothetical protein
MTCSLCGGPITPDQERLAWKQMVGWVKPRGSKSMTGSKPTGAFAHDTCIIRLREGFAIEQQTLWSE